MDDVTFRSFQPADYEQLKRIMVDAFDGVSIDQGIEAEYGVVAGHDWRWRKGRHFDDDVRRDADGIIVAVIDAQPVGFISTWIDHEAGFGHIPNLSLTPECRGKGVGRRLVELALQRFRDAGITHAKIETLVQNEIGNRLYTSLGFREVARQIHFVAEV
ncbi:GNAT family N-acetyltransferase [bacterium]|nr:GNAT family N-acetyltransferase [bacterium]